MSGMLYDTGALYNQHMNDDEQQAFMGFYKDLFAEYAVKTIHDCSIGAGGTTIPLSRLGYKVSGSDLNKNLLDRAKLNFAQFNFDPHLFIADFREIGNCLEEKVDCIISTGNSLPHVDLLGFHSFLKSSSEKLTDEGLLFFDIRNWNTIVEEQPIIHAINPKIMTADEHRSVYLLFNWHDNGSVTFSFATSIDRNGKHVSMDVIPCPVYYPLLRADISKSLLEHGYELIKYIDMDAIWLAGGTEKEKTGVFDEDFANIQWYGVFARKIT